MTTADYVASRAARLSREERHELEGRLDDPAARDRLARGHFLLVLKFVRRYRYRARHQDDELIEAGLMALARALVDYKPARGEFTTLAWTYIRNAVIEACRASMRPASQLAREPRSIQASALDRAAAKSVLRRIRLRHGARAAAIARLYWCGELRLQEAGHPYGLGHERTRQILATVRADLRGDPLPPWSGA